MRNLPTGKNTDSVDQMLFLFRRLTVSDCLSCWCCSRLPPQHCRDSISMKRVDPLSSRTWPRIYQVCHDISRVLVMESQTGTAMISRVQSYSDLWSKNISHDNGCWRNLRNLDFHKIRVTKDFVILYHKKIPKFIRNSSVSLISICFCTYRFEYAQKGYIPWDRELYLNDLIRYVLEHSFNLSSENPPRYQEISASGTFFSFYTIFYRFRSLFSSIFYLQNYVRFIVILNWFVNPSTLLFV